MGIRFFCPNGHKLNVKSDFAGKTGFCPECGVRLIIPLESTRKSSKHHKSDSEELSADSAPDIELDPDFSLGSSENFPLLPDSLPDMPVESPESAEKITPPQTAEKTPQPEQAAVSPEKPEMFSSSLLDDLISSEEENKEAELQKEIQSRQQRRFFILVGSAVVLFLILAGFHLLRNVNTVPGLPKLYPVTLHLTLDGKPLADAIVSAVPEVSNFHWGIGGVTDKQGNLALRTNGLYPGAPEGTMTICVTKTESTYGPTAKTTRPDGFDEGLLWDEKVESERQEFRVVEEKFNKKETSPWKIEVKKGKNQAEYDFKKDGTQLKAAE